MDRRTALCAAAVILADQGSKTLVRETLAGCSGSAVMLCDRIHLVGPLGILRTTNGEGAFGLLDGSALWLVLLAALLVIGLALRREVMTGLLSCAIGLIIGGVGANLVDRGLYGAVTDFIDLRWRSGDLVLNPADLALGIGGGFLWVGLLVRRSHLSTSPSVSDVAVSDLA